MRIVSVIIAFLAFGYVNAQDVIIKGTLNGDLKGYNRIYLYTRVSNDSAEIVNGNYTFQFKFEKPEMKFLYPQYIKGQGMMYQPFGILISEPGTYYVNSDISQPMGESKLKGPQPMMELHNFESDFASVTRKINNLKAAIYSDKWYMIDEKSPLYYPLEQSTDSLNRLYAIVLIKKYVSKNPKSIASAYILNGFAKNIGSVAVKEDLLSLLSPEVKGSAAAKEFAGYIEGLKKSDIGESVKDFTLETPQKSTIDFNSFRGKYVLIDFWASWCWPCRNAFPSMRKLREQYKGKPFEIYSISIDEDKSAWLKAVKEEHNPWPQSWDNIKISNKLFAVTSIPATFLIDPNGKIIGKEVGYDPDGNSPIQKQLKTIFKD